MTTSDDPRGRIVRLCAVWALLAALSTAIGGTLEACGLPAALLIGPMIAGVLVALRGVRLSVSPLLFAPAQATIGAMLAGSLSRAILRESWLHLPLFMGMVCATIGLSTGLGWLMTRARLLPGSTAIWGSSPGAASAMMLIAGAFGADMRLVAFMQYLRVVFVAVAASVLARLWPVRTLAQHAVLQVHAAPPGLPLAQPHPIWFDASAELLLVCVCAALGRRLRLPAGPLLLTMAIGGVLHVAGGLRLILPTPVLAISYAMIGWRIGLAFTPSIVRAASRAILPVIASILVLIGFGMLQALGLVRLLGIDLLTAYLATSPGGMDSVAIISASTPGVDLSFVTALQTMRFLLVLALMPLISRLVASRLR